MASTIPLPTRTKKYLGGKPLVQLVFYNNPDGYPPIINSVRLLARAGFEVDLFCRDNGENWGVEYPASVRLHRVRSSGGNSWREYGNFGLRVLKMANRRAGVFVGHDMHGLLIARLLATLCRRPLVYHCHDYSDVNDAKRILTRGVRVVRNFEQRFARTADLVIVPDADRAKVMSRELGLSQNPLIVANAPLKSALVKSQKLRETLALQGKNFERVVFRQGRIGDGHALEATLRSMPAWKSRTWGFVIMGPGENTYRDHLLQIAQELGVQEQFVILPPVGYDQVAHYTVGADVGHALYQPIHVNNIHISTASNKIMEYLCAGLPLLVSDRPALRALVEQHNCGVVADEADPRSIANAINELLGHELSDHELSDHELSDHELSDHELSDHRPEEQTMGAAARRAFEEVFCYDRQFAPVVEAMRKLAT